MPAETTIESFRRELHQHPELSGEEKMTSDKIASFLATFGDMVVVRGVGGHGIVAQKQYGPGATVAFRAELDGLPIAESGNHSHKSKIPGHSHACGHDGHMSILLRLVEKLEQTGTDTGTLLLIFQPSEETGMGAKAMIDTGFFNTIDIDQCYALHNIPGSEMGAVLAREGTFACASVGLRIELVGKTAHAAHPEQALNPLIAATSLLQEILNIPKRKEIRGFALATPIALQSGDQNFGTSPESAILMFTLRSDSTESLDWMVECAKILVVSTEAREHLQTRLSLHEYFPATVNDLHMSRLEIACDLAHVPNHSLDKPYRWSEDFGRFRDICPVAMFGLGSGKDTAPLHASTYDFPDQLIDTGAEIFYQLYNAHFP